VSERYLVVSLREARVVWPMCGEPLKKQIGNILLVFIILRFLAGSKPFLQLVSTALPFSIALHWQTGCFNVAVILKAF
jgi:hypothetical protein